MRKKIKDKCYTKTNSIYTRKVLFLPLYEMHHEKTCFLHMGKQRPDQLCSNHTAGQCLCFYYIDSTNPLFRKSEIPCL